MVTTKVLYFVKTEGQKVEEWDFEIERNRKEWGRKAVEKYKNILGSRVWFFLLSFLCFYQEQKQMPWFNTFFEQWHVFSIIL